MRVGLVVRRNAAFSANAISLARLGIPDEPLVSDPHAQMSTRLESGLALNRTPDCIERSIYNAWDYVQCCEAPVQHRSKGLRRLNRDSAPHSLTSPPEKGRARLHRRLRLLLRTPDQRRRERFVSKPTGSQFCPVCSEHKPVTGGQFRRIAGRSQFISATRAR